MQLLGIVYLAVGIGVLINKDVLQMILKGFVGNSCVIHICGIATVAIGYLMVSFYNNWHWSWLLLITIIGWLALLKGLFILLFPQSFIGVVNWWMTKKWLPAVWPICVILLGAVMSYLGFFVV